MSTPTPAIPGAPPWPYCAHGADPATDPVGCLGVHVPGHTACLAHLADVDRDAYLAGLAPGADIDHRGTPFTELLLDALLAALRDPGTGHPRLGDAGFEAASFEGRAGFEAATFQGRAAFEGATFQGHAWFALATFQGEAWFKSATFQGEAWFKSATFQSDAGFGSAAFQGRAGFGAATFQSAAWFEAAAFHGDARFGAATFRSGAWFEAAAFHDGAWFGAATFQRSAWFGAATFHGDARFGAAAFERDAWFEGVSFAREVRLGPLVCAGKVTLSRAVFGGPVTLALATQRLECRRTRWLSTAELRLRYATVDLAHAVLEHPLTIASEADPFEFPDGQPVAERDLADTADATVQMASLRGVDTAHLLLADVDLSQCLFTGTVHLDQLRLEGNCSFAQVPPGTHWRRWHPVRFARRRTLAEEHHWRANQPAAVQGWTTAEGSAHVGPLQLAPVYRALRKSFEDGKHEPGAADFYYGEMEMRRHADDIPRGERGLLHAYWLLSGYGLRASRALGWLAAAMLITITLLMGFGLPQQSPKQQATGTVRPGGGRVTFEIDRDAPQNPTGNRVTGERFEKALNVTLNSVVFRSSGQDLTTAGTYIEMASRLLEPTLIALAALAVRGRIKR
ncbi:pentapeptide repeat-containing protein [Streptomyces sp. NBC_01471]|uniref:pentapeptide repeat-containing protein n=1 Tax=Streptomyces sp. NBC_01471 TaxID=2903879 RepID=UPI00324CC805